MVFFEYADVDEPLEAKGCINTLVGILKKTFKNNSTLLGTRVEKQTFRNARNCENLQNL
jgi:hypothetical protein